MLWRVESRYRALDETTKSHDPPSWVSGARGQAKGLSPKRVGGPVAHAKLTQNRLSERAAATTQPHQGWFPCGWLSKLWSLFGSLI